MGGGAVNENRLLAALRALIPHLLPRLPFLGMYRYRVVARNIDGRLQLQAVNRALGLPDVLPISIVPGLPGMTTEPTLGSIVLVEFLEGDPAKPRVTHFSDEAGGFVPVSLTLDAQTTVRVGPSAAQVALAGGVQPLAMGPQVEALASALSVFAAAAGSATTAAQIAAAAATLQGTLSGITGYATTKVTGA